MSFFLYFATDLYLATALAVRRIDERERGRAREQKCETKKRSFWSAGSAVFQPPPETDDNSSNKFE